MLGFLEKPRSRSQNSGSLQLNPSFILIPSFSNKLYFFILQKIVNVSIGVSSQPLQIKKENFTLVFFNVINCLWIYVNEDVGILLSAF